MIEYLDFFPDARFNNAGELLQALGVLFVWTLFLHFAFWTKSGFAVWSALGSTLSY